MDSSAPTARFLQARIIYLRDNLIKRFNTILESALRDIPAPDTNDAADEDLPPSHTATAFSQFHIDVESTALIRAAEEIMVLTRSMKDVWLFGGLDTIKAQSHGEDGRMEGAQPGDVRAVAGHIQKYVQSGKEDAEADGQPEGSRRHRRQSEIMDDES